MPRNGRIEGRCPWGHQLVKGKCNICGYALGEEPFVPNHLKPELLFRRREFHDPRLGLPRPGYAFLRDAASFTSLMTP